MCSGTGAVTVLFRGRQGVARRDGMGWLLGDIGSAVWLGRRTLQTVAADLDQRGRRTVLTERFPDSPLSKKAIYLTGANFQALALYPKAADYYETFATKFPGEDGKGCSEAEKAADVCPKAADALQDAGCEDEQVLAHCRDEKAVHVRGCWVVDLVLGKA